MAFDTYAAFQRILNNEEVCCPQFSHPPFSFLIRYRPLSLPSLPSPSSYNIPMVCLVLALSSSTHSSQADTMFELVKALNDGAEDLKKQASNPISLNAGCELFTAFVTLLPHDSAVRPPRFLPIMYFQSLPPKNFADLKKELIHQGQSYAAEALTYRKKIAELAFGFIKDGSVVRLQNSNDARLSSHAICIPSHQILTHSYSRVVMQTLLLAHKRKRISGTFALNFTGNTQ